MNFTRQPFPNEAPVSKIMCSGARPGTNMARGSVMLSAEYGGSSNRWQLKSAQSLLRAGSEVIKEGATVNDVIKSTVQPTVGAMLGATVDQVASKLIEMRDKHDTALPPNLPIVVPEMVQAGSGRKRRLAPLYKKATKRFKYFSNKHPIIYNF